MRILFSFFFIILICLICLIIIGVFYFYVIPPKVISVYFLNKTSDAPLDSLSDVPLDSLLVIKFDKPIKRRDINYLIIPEAYGEWKFEDPLIKNHFFKTLIFEPKIEFQPNTTYSVELNHIRAHLDITKGSSFSFNFKTKSIGNVNFLNKVVFENVNFGQIFSEILKILFFNPSEFINTYVSDLKNDIKNKIFAILNIEKLFNARVPRNISEQSGNNFIGFDKNIKNNIKKKNINVTIIEIPFYWQKYPLSCEAASLRMALAAKGVNISEDDILSKIGFDKTIRFGNVWGNPHNAFVGSVSGHICITGYGVYWEPIAKAAGYWRPAEYFSGWNLQQLINELKLGNPVIFWGVLPNKILTDCSWYTSEGKYIKAFKETHVRVAVGFIGDPNNPTRIIIKDPLNGILYWSIHEFLTNWQIYGNSGVVIR